MNKHIVQSITAIIIFILFNFSSIAQEVNEPKKDTSWEKPYSPFRIAGNLYYVGTYDLACYLITTSKGSILINAGVASTPAQIKKNVEALGFRFKDIKILLTSQAHFDHVGGMAAIKKETHAKVMVDAADADVLATGGLTDYEMGKYGISFKPVHADRLLHDSDIISLGDMHIVMLHHPGHTKGSCSFLFTVHDSVASYRVLIANMPSIIVDKPFADVTAYPTISQDYAYTFQAMKKIHFDIWLAAHSSQFKLQQKHPPCAAYNPAAFIDQQGYDAELNSLQQQYDDKLKKDAAMK
ncbi:MAG: subclass B3 metallo-beta-lactamase [Parafilimonas sp.]